MVAVPVVRACIPPGASIAASFGALALSVDSVTGVAPPWLLLLLLSLFNMIISLKNYFNSMFP